MSSSKGAKAHDDTKNDAGSSVSAKAPSQEDKEKAVKKEEKAVKKVKKVKKLEDPKEFLEPKSGRSILSLNPSGGKASLCYGKSTVKVLCYLRRTDKAIMVGYKGHKLVPVDHWVEGKADLLA